MKTNAIIIFLILLVAQIFATAEEISVVDVKRNITLSDEDTVYKDFYLSAGEGSGLKKNLVVNVKRKLTVKDNAAKAVGDFETVVGQLRIILVEGKVAVGREYKLQSRDDEPMLEQIGMMTGDRIDLAGAFTDNKPAAKRKPAEAPPAVEDVKNPITPIESPITERDPAALTPPALIATPPVAPTILPHSPNPATPIALPEI